MPTGKSSRFLLVEDIESIACLQLAEVYPLWYRSIDLSTDPGLKSHLIIFHIQNELLHLLEPLYN
jgi:hypothetical protein